jgi:hypothetical protein
MDGEPMKVCIVSSCGGHLTEVRALRGAYARYPHHYVLNDYAELPDDMRDCTRFISHSERDWRFFVNLWEAASILRRERPEVLLSTGAGPIVPFAPGCALLLSARPDRLYRDADASDAAVHDGPDHVSPDPRLLLPVAATRALVPAREVRRVGVVTGSAGQIW